MTFVKPQHKTVNYVVNRLAPELFFFLNFSTLCIEIWIKEEPNTLELWNKLHFEEKETESIYRD